MVGRVLRPAEARPTPSFSIIPAPFPAWPTRGSGAWTLDPDRQGTAPEHQKRAEQPREQAARMHACGAVRVGGKPCPNCGFLPKRPAEFIARADGELGLVESGKARHATPVRSAAEWHAMLAYIAAERGYKPGWIAHKFSEKFGHWPKAAPSCQSSPRPKFSVGALAQHRLRQAEGCVMSRNKDKGRLPPFVPVDREMMRSPAWRATSWRALPVYSPQIEMALPVEEQRPALSIAPGRAEEMGRATRDSISRWYRELEYYGFVVKTPEAALGVDGKGKAPHWRLTEAKRPAAAMVTPGCYRRRIT